MNVLSVALRDEWSGFLTSHADRQEHQDERPPPSEPVTRNRNNHCQYHCWDVWRYWNGIVSCRLSSDRAIILTGMELRGPSRVSQPRDDRWPEWCQYIREVPGKCMADSQE